MNSVPMSYTGLPTVRKTGSSTVSCSSSSRTARDATTPWATRNSTPAGQNGSGCWIGFSSRASRFRHSTGASAKRSASWASRIQAPDRAGTSRSDPRPEGLGRDRRPGDGFLERGGSDRRDQMVHRGAGRTFQGRQIQAPGTLGLLLGRRGHPPLRGAHHSAERIHPLRRQAFLLDSLLAGQRP